MDAECNLVILDLDGTLTSYRLSATHDAPLILLPNVYRRLQELDRQGIALAVATNQITGDYCGRPYTDAVIEERLDELSVLLPMVPRRLMLDARPGSADWKPAPGMLLRILKETGIAPDRALFVGDELPDQQAAEAAGVAFAWAWALFEWPNGKADRSIDWSARGEEIWRTPQ